MTRKTRVWLLVLLLAGLLVLAYPVFSDYINRLNGSWAISQAQDALSGAEPAYLHSQRLLAQQYNEALLSGQTPDNYAQILNLSGGIMGYIQIPSIGVKLPVYHGVEEAVLEKGAGHLPQSAFPIGGEGNHAVITGHTGLPSARMFTDLMGLALDDLFYIQILGETLAYRVDSILVVLPNETQALAPEPGKDYCTLVTCTPYGINSHRLLVRGIRTELTEEAVIEPVQADEAVAMPAGVIAALAAAMILVMLILITLIQKKKE